MKYLIPFLFIVVLLGSCDEDDPMNNGNPSDMENPVSTTPNILLIIADDMGKDAAQGFVEGSIKPNTPNLDKMMSEGLVFNNFWANPTCSPTRSSIITGKYGYRTGVKWAGDELSQSETILQKYIAEETNNGYASAVIGKWHLSGNNVNSNPEDFGLEHYEGLIRGGVGDYYEWELSEDGSSSTQTDYSTKVFTDLSIEWINAQSEPWFLWLAYNAAHTPFHAPPTEMHSQGDLPAYVEGVSAIPYYMAALEAMDYQIGKLLEGIPEDELDNTVILFLGDNGTPGQVAQIPYSSNKSKGSVYQGGVNVPMFVSGAGVSRTGEDNNLICSTDIFSTLASIAGADVSEINDSKSFETLLTNDETIREFQYSEMDNGTRNLWAISNGRFKLIVNANGNEEMYNLVDDPYENDDLLEGTLSQMEQSAKASLEAELVNIRN